MTAGEQQVPHPLFARPPDVTARTERTRWKRPPIRRGQVIWPRMVKLYLVGTRRSRPGQHRKSRSAIDLAGFSLNRRSIQPGEILATLWHICCSAHSWSILPAC